MGANLSVPEKIAKLSRSGDSSNLQVLLTDLQRNDAAFRANRARYLEAIDEQRNTPLTLAAAKGHLACVQLLLQFGANVHHVNSRPEGGSALHEAVAHKHEAIVELLLRHGANPFVENVKGFTAMDIACSTRNVPLLRRLEQCAPYVGWVQMKVPQFGGLGSSWQRRWVVVSHRYPSPQTPPSRQLTHCVFLAYKNLGNTVPTCRVWLDGARAREVYNPKAEARLQLAPGPGPRVSQAGITLHHKHELPSGVYTTGGHFGGGQREGYTFYLRPDDGSQASVNALDRLICTINNRGFPPPGVGGSAASTAALGTAAAPMQPARLQLPAPQPGPLYSSMLSRPSGAASAAAGMPAMATAPGTWSTQTPAPAAGAALDSTESDEQIARRLQEEYDAEVARQMQEQQDGAGPAAAAAGRLPAAAGAPAPAQQQGPDGAAARPDYLTGGSFYPQVHYADPGSQGNVAPPPTLQQQPALRPAHSGPQQLRPSAPETPSAASVGHSASFGHPTAPTLLDVDYPMPAFPLASGPPGAAAVAASAAGAAGGGTGPPLPSLSASARHVSAPRLQDAAWLTDMPAAPPSRATSVPAAAPGAAATGARPENDAEDSSVCVYCMDAPATAGVLHGDSVHKCLCRECAIHLKESNVQACPMCREPVQAYIMRVF